MELFLERREFLHFQIASKEDRNLEKAKKKFSKLEDTEFHGYGMFLPDGTKHGEFIFFHDWEREHISKTCGYKNGKKDGKHTSFSFSGSVMEECSYKNGKRHGKYIEWHLKTDVKAAECDYLDGKLHGNCYSWFTNGEKAEEATFKKDKFLDYSCWNIKGEKLEKGILLHLGSFSKNWERYPSWQFSIKGYRLHEYERDYHC